MQKKNPNWLQVDDLYCFLRVCLPSSWCFVPIAVTEELSLIGTMNGHYTVYLKTKSLPTAYMGWQGMREGRSWALLGFSLHRTMKAHLGEPALSVQEHNRWILLMAVTCGRVQARVVVWIWESKPIYCNIFFFSKYFKKDKKVCATTWQAGLWRGRRYFLHRS